MKQIIFDVGANNGSSTLHKCNKNNVIFAFEPTPALIEVLKKKSLQFNNYHIIECAVSDYDGKSVFNIAPERGGGTSSLLDFNDNLDLTWKGRTDFKVKEQVDVDVIKLKTFMTKNNITYINYLHIDAQGCDLNVLMGLEDFIDRVEEGVLEVAQTDDVALYKGQYTKDSVINFLKENNFTILRIESNDPFLDGTGNEQNIYFKNNKFNEKI